MLVLYKIVPCYGYKCSECGYDVNAWGKDRLPESCPKCSEKYEYGSGGLGCSDEEYNYKWKT